MGGRELIPSQEELDQMRKDHICHSPVARLIDAIEYLNGYHHEVDQLLVCNHIGCADGDPRGELNKLLMWEQQMALDPRVSSEAAELVVQTKRAERMRLASLIHTYIDKLPEPAWAYYLGQMTAELFEMNKPEQVSALPQYDAFPKEQSQ